MLKERLASVNFWFFLLFVICISLNDRFMILSFDAWIFTYILDFVFNKRWNKKNLSNYYNLTFFLLFFYFLLSFISVFYSGNQTLAWKQNERNLSILIVAITGILGYNEKYDSKIISVAFISGSIISVFVITCSLVLNAYFAGGYRSDLFVGKLTFLQSVINSFHHRTYFGLTCIFAIIYLYNRFKNNSLTLFEKASYIFYIISAAALIILSEARIIFAILLVLLFVIAIIELKNQKFKITLFIFFIVGILFLIVLNFPRYQTLISGAGNQLINEPRIQIWQYALNILQENWLFGTGLGDVQDKLVAYYHSDNFEIGTIKQLNAHNQYLQSFLESGVVSFCLLILIVISYLKFRTSNNKNTILLFMISILCVLFVESILQRILGVFLFLIVPVFLSVSYKTYTQKTEFQNKISPIIFKITFGLTLLSIFFIILFLLYKPCFNSQLPRSYATQPYSVIATNKLSSLKIPSNAQGFSIGKPYFQKHSDGNGNSYMIINSVQLSSEDSIQVAISFKVSEEFNNGKVGISIGGQNLGYTTKYFEAKNAENWQRISLSRKVNKSGKYFVILIINSDTPPSIPTGTVSFVYPTIQIKSQDEQN